MTDDKPTASKGEAEKRRVKEQAARQLRAAQAAMAAGSISADEFVDNRKKSRNAEIADRAMSAASAPAPTDHTLDVGDQGRQVTEMAKATVEPDWNDNPAHLDTQDEVREDLRDDGLDPMDVKSKDEAMFGHFLVHAFADDDDRGGRTPEQLEAEHDMVVDAMREHGVNHDSPLDLKNIEGGDSVNDPYGVKIDLSLGGGL